MLLPSLFIPLQDGNPSSLAACSVGGEELWFSASPGHLLINSANRLKSLGKHSLLETEFSPFLLFFPGWTVLFCGCEQSQWFLTLNFTIFSLYVKWTCTKNTERNPKVTSGNFLPETTNPHHHYIATRKRGIRRLEVCCNRKIIKMSGYCYHPDVLYFPRTAHPFTLLKPQQFLTESRPCVGSGDGWDDDETEALVLSTPDLDVIRLDRTGHHTAVDSSYTSTTASSSAANTTGGAWARADRVQRVLAALRRALVFGQRRGLGAAVMGRCRRRGNLTVHLRHWGAGRKYYKTTALTAL